MLTSGAGAESFLQSLLIAAVRTSVLGAGAGLVLRLLRVKKTSARLFTWVALLYVGLSMPLLKWVLPPITVPIPFLRSVPQTLPVDTFAPKASSHAPIVQDSRLETPVSSSSSTEERAVSQSVSSRERQEVSKSAWIVLAVDLYLAISLLLLLRLAVGLVLGRRLVRSAVPIDDSRLATRLSSRTNAWRQNFARVVRESSLVSVPVTIGTVAPMILLPSTWREWDDVGLDAVLTHELAHVKRRDSLSQFASLIHRAIFWFSPFAWWLNHQIIELAEQASDEATLSGGTQRDDYARILLRFFSGIQAEPRRVYWQGVAMANAGKAERRLEKILAWKGTSAMSIKKSVVTALIALGLPAVYMAAAARPIFGDQSSQNASTQDQASPKAGIPGVQAPPASTPEAPNSPASPTDEGVSKSSPAPVQPSSPLAPVVSDVPTAPAPPVASPEDGFDEGQRFVIVSGKSDAFTMSGTSEDARHVERLRTRIPGDFIWFERDEKPYIIRDQATINRARQLWVPQEELGKRQEELGKQQEALGKQQEELGSRMQEIRVKIPDITAELDYVKAELGQLGPNATVEQVGKLQAEIGELQAKVGQVQAKAGEEQGKIGDQMGALGERQGKLGEQQGELGRQQAELAQKANQAMKELLEDAIKKGTAEPEPGSASL